MYASGPINAYFAPELTVADGAAVVRLIVRPDFHHAAHAAHGAVYFKALDDAAFFAANSVVTEVFVLTVTFNVVLVRPVVSGTVTATGRLVHRSKNLLVAESELTDERGRLLARGGGTFAKSTTPLSPDVGYV